MLWKFDNNPLLIAKYMLHKRINIAKLNSFHFSQNKFIESITEKVEDWIKKQNL